MNDPTPILRPRARIMSMLGQELISSEKVAVIELVKNAYDADARHVLVELSGTVKEGVLTKGTMRVLDDGHGMDEDVIRSAWLEPATPFRRDEANRYSQELGRRTLGEKGVGRFAAGKLGAHLRLTSKSTGSREVQLEVDWRAFEDEDRYLDEIPLGIGEPPDPYFSPQGVIEQIWQEVADRHLEEEGGPLPKSTRGTLLEITDLQKNWTLDDLEEVRTALSRLTDPLVAEDEVRDDFRMILEAPAGLATASGLVRPPQAMRSPHYRLEADVSADGRAVGHIAINREPQERHDFDTPLSGYSKREFPLGPFSIRLNVYDRDTDALKEIANGQSAKSVRSLLDDVTGISIYRDGFRILPFGEAGNDWLDLNHRRVNNPTLRLSNNQVVGVIAIESTENPDLRDQTNREGLIDNTAYRTLQKAVLELLSQVETARYRHRHRDDDEDEREAESRTSATSGLLDSEDLSKLRDTVGALAGSDDAVAIVDEVTREYERRSRVVAEALSRYQRLATLGQIIDRVIHELSQPITFLRTELASAGMRANALISDDLAEKAALQEHISRSKKQANVLTDVLNRLKPFGGRRRGRPRKFYLETAIANVVSLLEDEIEDNDIEIRLPEHAHQVALDGTEFQEVLVNLLTNSIYWLQRVDGDRVIEIDSRRNSNGDLIITVEDSGPGIEPADHEHIFDPYFSRRPDGFGLGLAIAGEIVEDYYDGRLELVEPSPELGGAKFRATLRKRVGP